MRIDRPMGTPPAPPARVPSADRAPAPPPVRAPTPAKESRTATEAALWSVLTAEERAFFAQRADAGPLTYGPGPNRDAAPPPARGHRLDVVG